MGEGQRDLYYTKGLDVPDTPQPGTSPEPWKETRIIGKSIPRVDGYARVSGAAVYPSDIALPGMLYGAILRCPYPHARVRSVDGTVARDMPGVWAVITGSMPEADLDWSEGGVTTKLFDSHCRFEGEVVAAVAAEDSYQAWDAVREIRVDYEVLPYLVDERKAMESGAPKIHKDGNLVEKNTYARGDVEKGFVEADVILEEVYRSECLIHTPVELHGCVANWDGDLVTIWESTQGVYAVQKKVAQVLGMPLSKVRVIGHYLGGGFGSKLQAGKYTVIAALLAKKAARPVKLFLTREETYLATGNRPPSNMKLKAGVRKDGLLTALQFSCSGTGGAYPVGGTALVDWLIRDLYTCPNVSSEMIDVFTNTGPARPFRAPGHPQGSWALEQMMDALAEKIGMDPVELRLKNIPTYSQAREGNPPYTTTGLEACLKRGEGVRLERCPNPDSGRERQRRPYPKGCGHGELSVVCRRRWSSLHRHRKALLGRERQPEYGSRRHWYWNQNHYGAGDRRGTGCKARDGPDRVCGYGYNSVCHTQRGQQDGSY